MTAMGCFGNENPAPGNVLISAPKCDRWDERGVETFAETVEIGGGKCDKKQCTHVCHFM